jgi:hypothetical protein
MSDAESIKQLLALAAEKSVHQRLADIETVLFTELDERQEQLRVMEAILKRMSEYYTGRPV